MGNKWGFVNKKGEIVIEPQFENAVSFSGGLAIVELGGGKWGYIDKKGKLVWKSFE
ncbi:MAG: WG repeat-containing protein [Thermodesulfobacteriota bacterium]